MKAQSVVDVILGEAVHGTRDERFADMVAIASAIQNRSTTGRTSPEDVVANSREFNAYGRSLPSGANAYRDLAQQAWDYVQQNGSTHTGMYYATPKAKDELPGGLKEVAATTGHQFFEDPKGRAFGTANGYVQPDMTAMVQSVNAGPAGRAYSDLVPPTAVSTTPVSAPKGLGMEALVAGGNNDFVYSLGPGRSAPAGDRIEGIVRDAITSVMGPDWTADVTSGTYTPDQAAAIARGERSRTGSARHTDGRAMDFGIVNTKTGEVLTNQEALRDIAREAAAKGALGIGFGKGYMDRDGVPRFHMDVAKQTDWGKRGRSKNADPAMVESAALGRAGMGALPNTYSPGGIPTPTSRPDPAAVPTAIAGQPGGLGGVGFGGGLGAVSALAGVSAAKAGASIPGLAGYAPDPSMMPGSIGVDMTGKAAPAAQQSAWDALMTPVGSLPTAQAAAYEAPRTLSGVSDARPMPSSPIAGATSVTASIPQASVADAALAGERVGAMVGPAKGTDLASAYQQAAQGLGAAGMRGIGGLGAVPATIAPPVAPVAPVAPPAPVAPITTATINPITPNFNREQETRRPSTGDVVRGALKGGLGGIPGAVIGGLNAAMTRNNPGPGGKGLGDALFNNPFGGYNSPTDRFGVNSADEAIGGKRGGTYTASNGTTLTGLGGNFGHERHSSKYGWTETVDPTGSVIGITYADGSRTPFGGKGLGAMLGNAFNGQGGLGFGLGSMFGGGGLGGLGGFFGGGSNASGGLGGLGAAFSGFGGGSFNGNSIDPRDGGWG